MNEARMNHKELAAALRVQPCTVRFWTRIGCPYIPCGRLKFYSLSSVQAWLHERDAVKQQAKKERQQEQIAA
jgi:phage terminase Nu1 subunit (DNA packaging protein)